MKTTNKADIYIERDAKWEGPFNRDQLRDFVSRGILTYQSLCRVERNGSFEVKPVEFFTGAFAPVLQYTKPNVTATNQSPTKIFGWLFIIGSLIALVCFLVMDVTVLPEKVVIYKLDELGLSVVDQIIQPPRVNNLGLMNTRMTGVIISIAVSLVGALMVLLSGRKDLK